MSLELLHASIHIFFYYCFSIGDEATRYGPLEIKRGPGRDVHCPFGTFLRARSLGRYLISFSFPFLLSGHYPLPIGYYWPHQAVKLGPSVRPSVRLNSGDNINTICSQFVPILHNISFFTTLNTTSVVSYSERRETFCKRRRTHPPTIESSTKETKKSGCLHCIDIVGGCLASPCLGSRISSAVVIDSRPFGVWCKPIHKRTMMELGVQSSIQYSIGINRVEWNDEWKGGAVDSNDGGGGDEI